MVELAVAVTATERVAPGSGPQPLERRTLVRWVVERIGSRSGRIVPYASFRGFRSDRHTVRLMRRDRPASDVRTGQPVRRDGTLVDARQDRTDGRSANDCAVALEAIAGPTRLIEQLGSVLQANGRGAATSAVKPHAWAFARRTSMIMRRVRRSARSSRAWRVSPHGAKVRARRVAGHAFRPARVDGARGRRLDDLRGAHRGRCSRSSSIRVRRPAFALVDIRARDFLHAMRLGLWSPPRSKRSSRRDVILSVDDHYCDAAHAAARHSGHDGEQPSGVEAGGEDVARSLWGSSLVLPAIFSGCGLWTHGMLVGIYSSSGLDPRQPLLVVLVSPYLSVRRTTTPNDSKERKTSSTELIVIAATAVAATTMLVFGCPGRRRRAWSGWRAPGGGPSSSASAAARPSCVRSARSSAWRSRARPISARWRTSSRTWAPRRHELVRVYAARFADEQPIQSGTALTASRRTARDSRACGSPIADLRGGVPLYPDGLLELIG